MASIWIHIQLAAKEAPRMYFAPLIGAIRGIRQEYRRLDREHRIARTNALGDRTRPGGHTPQKSAK